MKKDAEIIGIWGARGSGKTTRQKELLRERERVIVLDPMGNFQARGFKVISTLPALWKIIKAGWNTGFRVIVRTGHHESACIAFMQRLTRGLFIVQGPYKAEKDSRTICLVIDEVQKFFPNRRMEPKEQEPLEDMIALGRHYGIEIIAASQRLAKVWTEFRGNASQHYFFSAADHTDLQAVGQVIGPKNRELVAGLRVHEYLHFSRSAGGAIVRGKNKADFK